MTEPQHPPAPPEAQPQAPAPRPSAAERMQARRESYKPGKPPELDRVEITPDPPRLRELDTQIEAELEAAMAGLSDKDMYGEPAKDQAAAQRRGQVPATQTGKVLRVHHGDVFIEVPGGRSQGLIPSTQFPE